MVIWKLTPLDLRDPAWKKSWYKAEAIIRAENAQRARSIADSTFVKISEARLGEDISWQCFGKSTRSYTVNAGKSPGIRKKATRESCSPPCPMHRGKLMP